MTPETLLSGVRNLSSGDYAEVGVYQGDFAVKIAWFMDPNAKLWLFDSLEGHGEPCEHDRADCHPRGRYSDTSADQIIQKIHGGGVGHTADVDLVIGFVPDTLHRVKAGSLFRFVRIDVDHYKPTKAATEFFLTRMVPSGVIYFDDWMCGDTPGATLAIQEVLGDKAGHYYQA